MGDVLESWGEARPPGDDPAATVRAFFAALSREQFARLEQVRSAHPYARFVAYHAARLPPAREFEEVVEAPSAGSVRKALLSTLRVYQAACDGSEPVDELVRRVAAELEYDGPGRSRPWAGRRADGVVSAETVALVERHRTPPAALAPVARLLHRWLADRGLAAEPFHPRRSASTVARFLDTARRTSDAAYALMTRPAPGRPGKCLADLPERHHPAPAFLRELSARRSTLTPTTEPELRSALAEWCGLRDSTGVSLFDLSTCTVNTLDWRGYYVRWGEHTDELTASGGSRAAQAIAANAWAGDAEDDATRLLHLLTPGGPR